MRAVRVLLVAAGVAVAAVGVRLVFAESALTHPRGFATWFAGSLAAHDGVLAPVAFAVGVLLARRVRGRYRAPVQAGLVTTGVLALVALPLVTRAGQRPDDPSALPLPYARNLLLILAAVWLGVAAVVLWLRRSGSRG